MHLVDEDLIERYREDGVVCLRGAIEPAWIERLRAGVDRNWADKGPQASTYSPVDQAKTYSDDYCNWQRIPEYRDFIFQSSVGRIAGALTGSRSVRWFHDHVFVKDEGTQEKTPWHQDYTYYCVDGEQGVSFWIPLDPIDKTNWLEFLVGSHRWGMLFTPQKFNGKDTYKVPPDLYKPLPTAIQQSQDVTIIAWEMEPGDILAFDFKTVHGHENTREPSRSRRRVFVGRFLGDDMRFTHRPGEKSPDFGDLGLNPGDALNHDLFPVVFEP